jgi:hypothetical protein
MDALKTILAVIGLAAITRAIMKWLEDRSGNSGRSGKHWTEGD